MWHEELSAGWVHALQHANYALEDFESSPTCDTSNPSTGWFLVPSLHGFKAWDIVFDWVMLRVSGSAHTHQRDLWWRSLMSSVIEFFSPVSLWKNWLSSHTIFRSHLLVMTLGWGVQELFAVLWTKCINALLHRGGSKISFTPCGFALGAEWVRYSMLVSSKLIGEPNKKKKKKYHMNIIIHNLCCHTCGGHSGAVLVLVQLWGCSTSSSESICFHSNGLDLILKEHTCFNKALTPVAQIRA